ncbi:MAG TPA: tetratricopeptide repeat protein [Gammaproteobacteria bacterium]|jgi:tetratricopeptide (TPR) repeat protein|nr:tetratricopeptide repeat protein [Gammaproteobacteria bacterium]
MNIMDKHNPNKISEQIKTLASSALALATRGEIEDAERVYERILAIAPYHASSLSFMAAQVFSRGDTQSSLMYIDKAIQGNPRNPLLLQSRARVYSSTARYADALKDLDGALALQPDLYSARLQKAFALKEMGDWNGAIKIAASIMRDMPDFHAWEAGGGAGAGELPALALQAANIVRAAQLAFIDAELQPIMAKSGKESLKRVFEGIAAFTGLREREPDVVTPRTRSLRIDGLDEDPLFSDDTAKWPPEASTDIAALKGEAQELLRQYTTPRLAGTESASAEGRKALPAKYVPDLGTNMQDIAPTLLAVSQSRWLQHEPGSTDGLGLIQVPAGKHMLHRASGENWRLIGYTMLEGPDAVELSIGEKTCLLCPGGHILAGNHHDHTIEIQGSEPCLLLSLRLWHPGLSETEIAGLAAVLVAFARFRAKYL